MTQKKNRLYGVIYMSTARLELLIADLKNHTIVERASSPSFVQVQDKSRIYQTGMERIIASVTGFQQILADYGVKNYGFWGSQQLINDITARYLAEQIYNRTGLHITWLSTSQLNYFRAVSLMGHSREAQGLSTQTTYLLYIGSASASLMKFHNLEYIQGWNIRLGYLEIDKLYQTLRNATNDPAEIIEDYIGSKLDYLGNELDESRDKDSECTLVLQGFAGMNNYFLSDEERTEKISTKKYLALIEKLEHSSMTDIQKKLHVDSATARHVLPGSMITRRLQSHIRADKVWLTRLNVWDGLALQVARHQGMLKHNIEAITLTSSINLAHHYLSDDGHRKMSVRLALHIFDQLKKLHHLGTRDRLLLEIGANVADIGNFISQYEHYHHSYYILKAHPIIGLSDKENSIIAELARYHSAEAPAVEQYHYGTLDADVQMRVAKLVAILRLADALDDSHQQKISRLTVSLREHEVVLTAYASQDLALEEWAFDKKSQLFYEVYGLKAVLKQRRSEA